MFAWGKKKRLQLFCCKNVTTISSWKNQIRERSGPAGRTVSDRSRRDRAAGRAGPEPPDAPDRSRRTRRTGAAGRAGPEPPDRGLGGPRRPPGPDRAAVHGPWTAEPFEQFFCCVILEAA